MAGFMGVKIVSLAGLNFDKGKTISKTKNFLENDFPDIMNYSGLPVTYLSSPLLDPTGVHGGGNVNHQPDQFLKAIEQQDKYDAIVKDCENATRAVVEAMNSCPDTERDPYRKILVRRYVKNDFAQWIYNDMNYSPRTYGRKRDEALYIFAQHLERYRKKYNAQKLIPILMARK